MFLGFNLHAWITILTVLTMFSVLLFTKLRSDLVFLGAIGILYVTGVLDAVARLMVPVATLSSFLSNTTVVALFVNIVKIWSKKRGYRFSDFIKIGLPMNFIILAANIFIVNIVYPLTPFQ